MGYDIKLVLLKRKNISTFIGENDYCENTSNNFFTTDYFDILSVKSVDLKDGLKTVFSGYDESILNDDIIVQSYSLYSNDIMSVECDYLGDPFSDNVNYKTLPFLSIIQIHITPEIFARKQINESTSNFLNNICKDLSDIVISFAKANTNKLIIFKIYKMLSMGDFAIVLRASEADVSFKIASLIRQRYVKIENNKFVLYKTYTLLSLDNRIIQEDYDNTKGKIIGNKEKIINDKYDNPNCFSLRCCYSNLYWSQKTDINNNFSFDKKNIYGLNGRYDFCVDITEDEFLELFPFIKSYKDDSETDCLYEEDFNEGSDCTDIVSYIKYLMKNKYLSYINERYLVSIENKEEKNENGFSEFVSIDTNNMYRDFLDIVINDKCNQILQKYNNTKKKIDKINVYRKNLIYYMSLIKRLISLCMGINCLSDTRVYAVVLSEQLNIVLDSIEKYIVFIEKNNSAEVLNILEDYIRICVNALDNYAQYIRNNNLQSLQTPNYNIETYTSMEKILIGYSEFLKTFTEFYQRESNDTIEYFPVVVPDLSEKDVSVEIMFRDDILFEYEEEKKSDKNDVVFNNEHKFNSYVNNRCFMVISIPTLMELADEITIVPSLFHELAHQFRYEDRKIRNEMLLKHVTYKIMSIFAEEMVYDLENELKCFDLNRNFFEILQECFYESYIAVNNYNSNNNKLLNVPLRLLKDYLKKDLNDTINAQLKYTRLEQIYNEYINFIKGYFVSDDEILKFLMLELNKQFNKIIYRECNFKEKDKKNKYFISKEDINIFDKCAYAIVLRITGDDRFFYDKKMLEKWIYTDNDFDSELDWIANQNEEIGDNNYLFEFYSKFMDDFVDELENMEGEVIDNKLLIDDFLSSAYEKMCDSYDPEIKWNGGINSTYFSIYRFLGTDQYKHDNKKIFNKKVLEILEKCSYDLLNKVDYIIGEYREETADIMMCKIMDLTPFGYINVLSLNWRSDFELKDTYFRRSLNVIFSVWCFDDKKNELDLPKFKGICNEVLKKLRKNIYEILKIIFEKYNYKNDDIYFNIEKNDIEDYDFDTKRIDFLERINYFIDICIKLRSNLLDSDITNSMIIKQLKTLAIIGSMLYDMVNHGEEYYIEIKNMEELIKDYRRGIDRMQGLKKSINDSEEEIKMIFNFCNDISIYINNPYLSFNEIDNYNEFNKKSLDFLLEMFYVNKIKNAKKLR